VGESIDFEGISAYLADGGGSGIVVLHEWWGHVPPIKDVCDRFAALGFPALAPDLYHGSMAVNEEVAEAEELLRGSTGNVQSPK
jgi:carboxymethylenebutenolidase